MALKVRKDNMSHLLLALVLFSHPCRVVWSAPTGFAGHGKSISCSSADEWVKFSTKIGFPAKIEKRYFFKWKPVVFSKEGIK
jgi:hypothetical protein